MRVRIFRKAGAKLIVAGSLVFSCFMPHSELTWAFDLESTARDAVSIASAYTTHMFFHELGHQIVADDVGANSHRINFFTRRNGQFYLGLSTYQKIPKESRLPYAVGGEKMTSVTFEYALQSYRRKPTTFNKALMFFSNVDFLVYTLLSNYVYPNAKMHDPNLIREETGCSKGLLLSMVAAKTLLNTYRIMNEDAKFAPMIRVDKKSALFLIRFEF